MTSLQPIRVVRFDIRPCGDGPDPGRIFVPYVDGVSLVDLVSVHEHAAGFDVPGSYDGVIADNIAGSLAAYLLGRPDPAYRPGTDLVALLGCGDCGQTDCWPLEVRVVTADGFVVWTGFRQPFRPDRDYTGFGPFVFGHGQYEDAVREAAGGRDVSRGRS